MARLADVTAVRSVLKPPITAGVRGTSFRSGVSTASRTWMIPLEQTMSVRIRGVESILGRPATADASTP